MNRGELALGVIIIVLSIFLWDVTRDFPPSLTKAAPDPDVYPRLLLGSLIVLSAILIFDALRGPKRPLPPGKYLLLLVCTMIGLVYLILIPILGYFVTTPLFLFLEMYILQYRKISISVLVALVFTIFGYVFFYRILVVDLPLGLLGFFTFLG